MRSLAYEMEIQERPTEEAEALGRHCRLLKTEFKVLNIEFLELRNPIRGCLYFVPSFSMQDRTDPNLQYVCHWIVLPKTVNMFGS